MIIVNPNEKYKLDLFRYFSWQPLVVSGYLWGNTNEFAKIKPSFSRSTATSRSKTSQGNPIKINYKLFRSEGGFSLQILHWKHSIASNSNVNNKRRSRPDNLSTRTSSNSHCSNVFQMYKSFRDSHSFDTNSFTRISINKSVILNPIDTLSSLWSFVVFFSHILSIGLLINKDFVSIIRTR